jgi:hypothetical protein
MALLMLFVGKERKINIFTFFPLFLVKLTKKSTKITQIGDFRRKKKASRLSPNGGKP